MLGNGMVLRERDLDYLLGQMGHSMRECGLIIELMGKAGLFMLMETYMKVVGWMTSRME